jgi:hypothetical protein
METGILAGRIGVSQYLERNEVVSSTKQAAAMEFHRLPPIEQKALDGWGTVSFPVSRKHRWETKQTTVSVAPQWRSAQLGSLAVIPGILK